MSDDSVDVDEDEGGRPDEVPDAIAPGSFGFTFWRLDDVERTAHRYHDRMSACRIGGSDPAVGA